MGIKQARIKLTCPASHLSCQSWSVHRAIPDRALEPPASGPAFRCQCPPPAPKQPSLISQPRPYQPGQARFSQRARWLRPRSSPGALISGRGITRPPSPSQDTRQSVPTSRRRPSRSVGVNRPRGSALASSPPRLGSSPMGDPLQLLRDSMARKCRTGGGGGGEDGGMELSLRAERRCLSD